MHRPISIQPDAFYDDATLNRDAGIRFASLARARKSGELRSTRRGGRVLYLGQWVIDWLASDPSISQPERQEALAC